MDERKKRKLKQIEKERYIKKRNGRKTSEFYCTVQKKK